MPLTADTCISGMNPYRDASLSLRTQLAAGVKRDLEELGRHKAPSKTQRRSNAYRNLGETIPSHGSVTMVASTARMAPGRFGPGTGNVLRAWRSEARHTAPTTEAASCNVNVSTRGRMNEGRRGRSTAGGKATRVATPKSDARLSRTHQRNRLVPCVTSTIPFQECLCVDDDHTRQFTAARVTSANAIAALDHDAAPHTIPSVSLDGSYCLGKVEALLAAASLQHADLKNPDARIPR